VARSEPTLLNSKIPRSAFDGLLSDIGELVVQWSESNTNNGSVRNFLDENPLPECLVEYLPLNYRAYCLGMNALKQWVSAEQAATDRYVLGGTVRRQCKDLLSGCLISGVPSSECTIELHHPVRDGRPPIPLCAKVHAELEGQFLSLRKNDPIMNAVYPLKKEGHRSWVMLKLGCDLLLGVSKTLKSKNVQNSSKTFARKASRISGLGFKELLDWLDDNGLIAASARQ